MQNDDVFRRETGFLPRISAFTRPIAIHSECAYANNSPEQSGKIVYPQTTPPPDRTTANKFKWPVMFLFKFCVWSSEPSTIRTSLRLLNAANFWNFKLCLIFTSQYGVIFQNICISIATAVRTLNAAKCTSSCLYARIFDINIYVWTLILLTLLTKCTSCPWRWPPEECNM